MMASLASVRVLLVVILSGFCRAAFAKEYGYSDVGEFWGLHSFCMHPRSTDLTGRPGTWTSVADDFVSSSWQNGDLRLTELQDDTDDDDWAAIAGSGPGRLEVYLEELSDLELEAAGFGAEEELEGEEGTGELGGVWGKVCGDSFTDSAADVACRQLGFAEALYWYLISSSSSSSASSSVVHASAALPK